MQRAARRALQPASVRFGAAWEILGSPCSRAREVGKFCARELIIEIERSSRASFVVNIHGDRTRAQRKQAAGQAEPDSGRARYTSWRSSQRA